MRDSVTLNGYSFLGGVMLDKVKEEIKTVSSRIREAQDNIVEQADELLFQARHKAHLVKGEGAERLWHFENQALDWVEDVIDRADVPGVDKVRENVGKLVGQARENVTACPVEDYDGLNARAAADAVRALNHVDLLKIERIETDGKARKTVFEAIARRRQQLQKPPFRGAA